MRNKHQIEKDWINGGSLKDLNSNLRLMVEVLADIRNTLAFLRKEMVVYLSELLDRKRIKGGE